MKSSPRALRPDKKWLVLIAALILGGLVGMIALGWVLLPSQHESADIASLSPDAKQEYVALSVEQWSVTQDLAQARERLRGLSSDELRSIIDGLVTTENRAGRSLQAARYQSFARAYGLNLDVAAIAPSATPRPTAAPGATAPPSAPAILISDSITGTLRATLLEGARSLNMRLAQAGEAGDVVVDQQNSPGARPLAERVYAVADWFPSSRTAISSQDLRGLWQGKATADGVTTLLVSAETQGAISFLWGAPASNVKTVPEAELAARVWADHAALAILPFDALTPNLKLLTLDDVNLLQREASLDHYPLVVRHYLKGNDLLVNGLLAAVSDKLPVTNRDPARMTTLIMTGVTAISRTSALKIDQSKDPALPARKVAPVLAAADITHVSNETPFTDECKPVLEVLVLCSKPGYIESLKLAGVDIIGLTGNHLLDYGPQAFLDTLDLFVANSFRYYGGGRDTKDARKILYIQDHGNKLAFLGVNTFGPPGDWATATRPGAQQYNAAQVKQDLAEAKKNADVVLIEYQADETYEYTPDANNMALFHDGLNEGADVVTGVQAHQPQALEFSPDGKHLILYGLGNLFFDQMQSDNVRQGLVVRHTIYRGHLIQTELLPTLLEDFVQPRWATPTEAEEILKLVFDASGFK